MLPGDVDLNSAVRCFFSGLCLSFPALGELAALENCCFPTPMRGCVAVQGSQPAEGETGPIKQLVPSLCLSNLKGKCWEIFLMEDATACVMKESK